MNNLQHKKAIRSWVLYDWANSTYVTTVMAAVLPVYYASVAASDLAPNIRTAYWSYTTSISLFIVAILGPILGAMADYSGRKKKFLITFMLIGVIASLFLYFVREGDWLMASIIYIAGGIGFSGANVFYDSLLPHVANKEEIDQVSSRGFAIGYLGGGILLAINLLMIKLLPGIMINNSLVSADLTIGDLTVFMTRLTFVTVAIWWFLFSIPLMKNVHEPPRHVLKEEIQFNALTASLKRLSSTFGSITKYKELLKFIIAFWLYNNGIGTIIFMATIYGTELGFSDTTTIGTLLMVQFVAMPFAIIFGKLAKIIGTKRSILISLFIYTLIAIGGYFLKSEIHFWLLGFAVAMVQGGSQALSRSLFGRMVPKSKSAEFYSFFSISEKIAGTVGPLTFGIVSQIMGGSRLSIISLIIFFITGGYLLTRVNVNDGIKVAEFEEEALRQASLSP